MPWDALREDASYLVQTSAIDSLSAFPGDDTLAAAMRLPASRHPLVRGMPISARKRQGVRWAMRNAQACETGCLPYDETPAAGLIRMFGRCNYRNQCAILNSLSDVYPEISRSSQERIRRFCQELADRDMCAAVQEAYDRLIRISRHRL